ncbi:hypothetical protein GMO_15760 [Gluconobacter morbifer G707]|uniref:Uncharacterized protein n=1 Tax=Gluconobacter morbifer G707 TaxID=1088869 RepID=G6XJB0_9PROT|nr:hypothetical protein GMO_15760 [Gluconobacter morbifer G707]
MQFLKISVFETDRRRMWRLFDNPPAKGALHQVEIISGH